MLHIVNEYLAFCAWMLVLTIAFQLPERRFAAGAHSTLRDRIPNFVYLVLVLPLILLLQIPFAKAFEWLIGASGGGIVAHFMSPARSIPGLILFALAFAFVWDLWQYWLHRLQHASPLLWEVHRFHHSDEAVNATTQGRQHLLSHLLGIVWHAPLVVVFGALSPHAFAGVLFFRVWGFVNHADVRISFGRLTTVISGPQWHRIHHSVRSEHRDRNFAAFFPCIDRMFGTYYGPASDEYPETGLARSDRRTFMSDASFAPIGAWWMRLRQSTNVRVPGDHEDMRSTA